jgi:squalene-hopene/tetraprenyl-beta-curcumene cyclase
MTVKLAAEPLKSKKSNLDFDRLSRDEMRTARDKGVDYLLSLQKKTGYWEGEVYDNVTITAEYILFRRLIRKVDQKIERDAISFILNSQLESGAWNLFYDGPGEISATVESYQALKAVGYSKDHPALKKARKFIFDNGGLNSVRVFTRINLAFFGQYPWDKLPQMPPELMLIPKEVPFNIWDFSSWSRSVIIPLLIIMHHKPTYSLPPGRGIEELYSESPQPITFDLPTPAGAQNPNIEKVFLLIDRLLKVYHWSPIKPFRKKALKMAEDWIIKHQDRSGYWGGIFPAMVNSVLALLLQGYSFDNPIVYHGLKAVDRFASKKDGSYRVQSTVSPVWDTAITLYTLMEAGVDKNSTAVRKSARWLLRRQVRRKGDWSVKSPGLEPGGWAFEFENDFFPDNDDTALVLLALQDIDLGKEEDRKKRACQLGLDWLLGMQCSDGGWGAFDKDNNRQILNEIPFADLKSLLDPSSPDVTGHVLEIIGRRELAINHPSVQAALKYLKVNQQKDGSWFGRWGVNYIYGTSAVLAGLEAIKENMQADYVKKGMEWLHQTQNEDGGWGESCESYDKLTFVPCSSTSSQTAWAIIGLLSAGCSVEDEAVNQGLSWLIKHQEEDGSWEELYWTGTGFPRHFYLRYDMYRLYFPVLALARALRSS